MDKYEYKVRSEEITKLIGDENYVEAAKLADTIDWRRVRSSTMLLKVAALYKVNRRSEDCRAILMIAYERYPSNRTVVYSLCEISIELDDVVAAIEYYKIFVKLAPRDNGVYTLRYRILEAQEASLEERIEILEELKKRDYQEEWAYELAYLYHRIGLSTKCVEECDDIILWFGEGSYVKKAMELKMLHAPLTPVQQAKYDEQSVDANEDSYASPQYYDEDGSAQYGQGYESEYAADGGAGYADSYGNNYSDGYGNGYDDSYGSTYGDSGENSYNDSYGSTYGDSGENSYNDSYGNNYGDSYENGYDDSYGSNYGGSGENSYNDGYGNNYSDGYENGYADSYGNTYGDGSENSYNDGYGNTYGDGSENSYADGYGNTYNDGYSAEESVYADRSYDNREDNEYALGGQDSYSVHDNTGAGAEVYGVEDYNTDPDYTGEFYVEQSYDYNGNLIDEAMTENIESLNAKSQVKESASGEDDMSQYNTINLQKLVAESMKEIFADDDAFAKESYLNQSDTDSLAMQTTIYNVNKEKLTGETSAEGAYRQEEPAEEKLTEETSAEEAYRQEEPAEEKLTEEAYRQEELAEEKLTEETSAEEIHMKESSVKNRENHEECKDSSTGEDLSEGNISEENFPEETSADEKSDKGAAGKISEMINGVTREEPKPDTGAIREVIVPGSDARFIKEESEIDRIRETTEKSVNEEHIRMESAEENVYHEPSLDESDTSMGGVTRQFMLLREQATTQTAKMRIDAVLAEWEKLKEENAKRHEEELRKKVVNQTGKIMADFDNSIKSGILGELENESAEENQFLEEASEEEYDETEPINEEASEEEYDETEFMSEEASEEEYDETEFMSEEVSEEEYDETEFMSEEASEEEYDETEFMSEEASEEEYDETEFMSEEASEEEYDETEFMSEEVSEEEYDETELINEEASEEEYDETELINEEAFGEEYNDGEFVGKESAEADDEYIEDEIPESEADYYSENEPISRVEKAVKEALSYDTADIPKEVINLADGEINADSDESKAHDIAVNDDNIDNANDIDETNDSDETNDIDETNDGVKAQTDMDTGEIGALSEKIVAATDKKSRGARKKEIREFTDEERLLFENFAVNKKIKRQILYAIEHMTLASYTGNVIITGEAGMDTICMAKNLVKDFSAVDGNFSGKVAKVSGENLNTKNLEDVFKKLDNGAIIIEKANGLLPEKLYEMAMLLNHENTGIIVVMEDTRKEIKKLLEKQSMINDYFNIRIDLKEMDSRALVTYAKNYALSMEYSIDELGELALYSRITNMQSGNHAVTKDEVRDIIDEAIYHSKKYKIKAFVDILFSKRYDSEDMIVLKERDFM